MEIDFDILVSKDNISDDTISTYTNIVNYVICHLKDIIMDRNIEVLDNEILKEIVYDMGYVTYEDKIRYNRFISIKLNLKQINREIKINKILLHKYG